MQWIDTDYVFAGFLLMISAVRLIEKAATPADTVIALAAMIGGMYALLNCIQTIDPDGV